MPVSRHLSCARTSIATGLRVRLGRAVSALALLAQLGVVTPTMAETLDEALLATYQTNPKLDAERARLRATDEEVPRAKAGFKPTANATADYGVQKSTTRPGASADGTSHGHGYQVNVRQSLFSGFRTVNTVREAEATVRAGRENLRNVEAQVLIEAVTAYADVLRDTALVQLRERAVANFTRELQAAEARRSVREVTRTDVAQTQTRRAKALSALDLARANLKASRASYERVVGRPPDRLRDPGLPRKQLPSHLDDAIKIAEKEAPNVVAALYREQAARHAVDKIWGELLPEVSLEAAYGQRFDSSPLITNQDAATVTGRLNMPLYEGGETKSRVRQAKHTHVSRIQEIEQARGETQAQVVTAWSRLQASKAQQETDRIQVQSAKTALEGVREEEKVGQRTLLEVLNAEQEVIEAEIGALSDRRDLTIAAYTLLSVIGRLNAGELKLGDSQYDPEVHYEDVRGKWFGVSITHADGRVEALEKLENWGAVDQYMDAQKLRPSLR
ncbi:MAG: TolC family outer membrane protein [Hyphomicrobiaceae bacterium]